MGWGTKRNQEKNEFVKYKKNEYNENGKTVPTIRYLLKIKVHGTNMEQIKYLDGKIHNEGKDVNKVTRRVRRAISMSCSIKSTFINKREISR